MSATTTTTRLVGSEVPRLWTRPLRRLTKSTSRGPEAIEFAEGVLGIMLYPWQRWFLLHALELNPNGTFRFRTILLLVARQNGKTTLLLILFLWRLYVDGSRLVIGTAQNLDIAEETWAAAVELAEDVPDLAREIEHVDKTNGKKTLRLKAGERYKVAAGNRRGGRSLSGDFVGLDELREHQTWDGWAAVTKTTMARTRAQVLGTSNAGDDKSIVLSTLRAKALEESEPTLGIFEYSAPEECDLRDRRGWAAANPSLGYGIAEETIASAAGTDPEGVFRTEVLCQWVSQVAPPVIPAQTWADHLIPSSTTVGAPSWAVDVSPARSRACIALCASTVDGRPQVEIPADMSVPVLDYREGTDWVIGRIAALRAAHGISTVYVYGDAAASLRTSLESLGLVVTVLSGRDMAQGCGLFYDEATKPVGRGLVHLGQPELNEALSLAQQSHTDSGWQWARRKSAGDISPLVAVTVALWAHLTTPAVTPDIF